MEFDLTQWWVPAAAMALLLTYILRSFVSEYRMPKPALPMGAAGPVEEEAGSGSAEAGSPSEPRKGKGRKKRGFLKRTSWIWGSVLIGAAGQIYLSHIAPLLAA